MSEPRDNLIDLDAYRSRRITEGTWPPADDGKEYWRSRRRWFSAKTLSKNQDPQKD